MNFTIQTEPGSSVTVDGLEIPLGKYGLANHSILLDRSQMAAFQDQQGNGAFYYNGEANLFTVNSSRKKKPRPNPRGRPGGTRLRA